MTDSATGATAVRLEFVDANHGMPDPSERARVAAEVRAELNRQGYSVSDAYTGAKGGDVLDVVSRFVHDNSATLFEMTKQITAVLAILAAARRKPEASKTVEPQATVLVPPIEIVVSLDTPPSDEQLLALFLGVDADLPAKVTAATRPAVHVSIRPRPPANL